MRREYEEEEHEEEKHDDGDDVVVLLPLISPRPPLLFICLPFLTTFNNFLVNFPSANGDAIAQTGFCFSSSPSPPLLADDGIGNPSRSRFEDLLFGVSFFSFLAFFALFSPLEPILNVCLMCCGAAKWRRKKKVGGVTYWWEKNETTTRYFNSLILYTL